MLQIVLPQFSITQINLVMKFISSSVKLPLFSRSLTSGVVFSKAKLEHPPLHISSIISRHCSSQSQLTVLQTVNSKAASYSCDNLIRNVTVPSIPNMSSALVKYARLRPRDLDLFVSVLVSTFESGDPVPAEDLVDSLVPKLKLHAQSLELVHTMDLCQDDLSALLHLLMKVNLRPSSLIYAVKIIFFNFLIIQFYIFQLSMKMFNKKMSYFKSSNKPPTQDCRI